MCCLKRTAAYLTVYFSIVLAVMLSLCLALIEGARQSAIRMEMEYVTEIGLDSVLAEYHRELLEYYNLFAIDTTYGTDTYGHERIADHLRTYIDRNLSREEILLSQYLYRDFLGISALSVKMSGFTTLADGEGTVFRKRAIEAIRDDYQIALLENMELWMKTVESEGLLEKDIASQKKELDLELEDYQEETIKISDTEVIKIKVENPTAELEKIRQNGIMKLLVKDENLISRKILLTEQLIQKRLERKEVYRGNLPIGEKEDYGKWEEKILFQEYLMKYMGCYGNDKEHGALSYEIEYLIFGRRADYENLERAFNRICAMREVANVEYLLSDQQKHKEVEALATLIATAVRVPELAKPLGGILILGWAYAESLHDMKLLMNGEKVPLLKDDNSWYYGLQNALSLSIGSGETGNEKGLHYKDYLRVLMAFEDLEDLTLRAMNVIEANMRLTKGNESFRLDVCCDTVECEVVMKSRYGYEYMVSRRRKY